MSYPNWLSQRAHLSGSRMALSYEGEQWSFAEMDRIAIDYAERLASFGITADSRVAILAKSHPESVFVMYACLHVGCEMVMLNERLSEKELDYQLTDSEAAFLLVDEELQKRIDFDNKILF
ncbi:MAG TPA: AMP-binding protein, partial [Planococcus sp. (in: firmicutes)]|nr:AMP-binding protein [Planococcus sp. (in: firmicutes)]